MGKRTADLASSKVRSLVVKNLSQTQAKFDPINWKWGLMRFFSSVGTFYRVMLIEIIAKLEELSIPRPKVWTNPGCHIAQLEPDVNTTMENKAMNRCV